MNKRSDILLDSNLDPQIANGDFVCGVSDQQNVNLLLQATKGSFREYPTVGVNLISYLHSTNSARAMRREINVQLMNDNYKVDTLTIDDEGTFELEFENDY